MATPSSKDSNGIARTDGETKGHSSSQNGGLVEADEGDDGLDFVELSQADIAILPDEPQSMHGAVRERFVLLRDSYLAEVKRLPPTQRSRQALLLHEVGRLEEEQLDEPDVALGHYREAYAKDSSLRSNLRSLRRLQLTRGEAAAAITTLDAEVRVCKNPAQRAGLLYERGLLQLGEGDERGAQTSLRRALDMDATFLPALALLSHLADAQGDTISAAKLLVRMAEICNDEHRKGLIMGEVGQLAQVDNRAGDALERFRIALSYAPRLVSPRFALEQLYTQRGEWGALTDLLLQRADRSTEMHVNAAHRFLAGVIARHRLGEEQRAAVLLEQCFEARSDRATPLEELQEIYARHGKSPELLATVRRMLKLGEGKISKAQEAALCFRMGELQELLEEPGEAVRLYKDAVGRHPGFFPARQALVRTLRAAEHWAEVAVLLRTEVDQEESIERRYELLVELAELSEWQLDDADQAIALFEEAFGIDAGRGPASRALERLYTLRQNWDGLVGLLGQMADHSADPGLRTALLKRMAWIQETHLERPDMAAETLERLLDAPPSDRDVALALGRVYQAGQRVSDLVRNLEREAGLTKDPSEALSLLCQAGELAEFQLADSGRARQLYLKVLEEDPAHRTALKRLGRVYLAAEYWDELVDVLRKELECEKNPQVAAIQAFRVGQLEEGRIGDSAAAERSYLLALQHAPEYAPARDALLSLLCRRGRWSDLAKLLLERAEREVAPDRRAEGFLRAALLTYHRVGKIPPSLELCQRARQTDRRLLEAHLFWEQLAAADGRHSELADSLAKSFTDDALPREDRVQLGLKLALIRRVYLDSADGALEAASNVLELDARSAEALFLSVSLARRQGHMDVLFGLLSRLADTSADPVTAVADLLQLSAVLPSEESYDAMRMDLFDRVLSIDPAHSYALCAQERLARGSGDVAVFKDILRRRAEDQGDPSSQISAFMTLGDLAWSAGDLDEAASFYSQAQGMSADWLPGLRALRMVREVQGRGAEVAELLEQETQVAVDPEASSRALMLAANIWLQSYMDTERAERLYAQVFEQDPHNGVAFQRLTALLGGRDAHEELVAAYRRRIGVADSAEKTAIRLELAKVCHGALGKPEEAVAALEEVLRAEPRREDALTLVAQIYREMGRFRPAALLLERLAGASQDPAVVRAALLERATLLEQHLGEDNKALAAVLAVLATDPGDREALEISARLHGRLGRHDGTAEALTRLAERASPGDRARILLELAEVSERGLGRPEQAHEHVARAAALCCLAPDACPLVEGYFTRRNDAAGLDALLARVLKGAPAQAAGVLPLRLLRARNLTERLGQHDEAEREIRQALTESPGSVEALLALGELHLKRDNAALAQVELQAVLERNPFDSAAYLGLRRAFQARGEMDRARLAAQVLLALEAGSEEEGRLAAEIPRPVHCPLPESPLGLDGYLQLLATRDDSPAARQFLRALSPHLHLVLQTKAGQYGVEGQEDLPASHPLKARAMKIAGIIGVEEPFQVVITRSHPEALALEHGELPLIIVGSQLADVMDGRLDFGLGRALGRVLAGTAHLETENLRELEVLMAGVASQFDRSFGLHLGGDEDLQAVGRGFFRQLSRKDRKAVEEPARVYAGADPVGMYGWAEAAAQGAARCGLLCSADLVASLVVLRQEGASDEEVAGVCIFNISPRYTEARSRLGLA